MNLTTHILNPPVIGVVDRHIVEWGIFLFYIKQVGALYSERASRSLPSARSCPPLEPVVGITIDNHKGTDYN